MSRAVRAVPRRHLIYYLKVVAPATGDLIGRLVDITPVGMMIIGENPNEVGQQIPIRLMLPGDPSRESCLDLIGETVWCHRDVNPDYYATGFRFVNPSPMTIDSIQELVTIWGFQD